MSSQGNQPGLSPAFASFLKQANNTVVPKPNFSAPNQAVKPKFTLPKKKDETALKPAKPQVTPNSFPFPNSPVEAQTPKTTSPFANLVNKNKEVTSSFASASLEKISAKYLKSSGYTPRFGSTPATGSGISCPVFARDEADTSPACQDIRPLAASNEIQIPRSNHQESILSTSAGSDVGSPSSKFTFSPIPSKTACGSSPIQDSKLSSLSKLKAKNARVERTFAEGSPSPTLEERKRFTFDLSSALVTRRPAYVVVSKVLTPQRQTQEHTIVVDQLACVADARTLLEPHGQKFKRISSMGRVICKKWKAGTCENVPFRYKPPHHIPAFKFDTMSPDDEIQSKFKRRR